MSQAPLRETIAFLERHLPPRPARVLQIGAGNGAAALELARRGYAVTALDEPPGPDLDPAGARVVWVDGEFLHFDPEEPFDVILFAGALASLQPVGRALDRALDALAPGGLVLAEEIAFDRVNVHTARWFYDLESVLLGAEVIEPPDPRHAEERRPLARWRQEHAFDPPLASGHDMLAAARERLDLSSVEEAPYLFRELATRAKKDPRASRVVEVVFELESRLVRERDLAAAGLRFAGKRLL